MSVRRSFGEISIDLQGGGQDFSLRLSTNEADTAYSHPHIFPHTRQAAHAKTSALGVARGAVVLATRPTRFGGEFPYLEASLIYWRQLKIAEAD